MVGLPGVPRNEVSDEEWEDNFTDDFVPGEEIVNLQNPPEAYFLFSDPLWVNKHPYYELQSPDIPWCSRIVVVNRPGDKRMKIFEGENIPNLFVLGGLEVFRHRLFSDVNHSKVYLSGDEVLLLNLPR